VALIQQQKLLDVFYRIEQFKALIFNEFMSAFEYFHLLEVHKQYLIGLLN